MAAVTLQPVTVDFYAGQGDVARVRVYYDSGFVSSTGIPIAASSPYGGNFYREVRCPIYTRTVAGSLQSRSFDIPSLEIESTEDALDNPFATLSVYIADARGLLIGAYSNFTNIVVPATIDGSSTYTWAQLAEYQEGPFPPATPAGIEVIQDTVAQMLRGSSGSTFPYDDNAGTLTIPTVPSPISGTGQVGRLAEWQGSQTLGNADVYVNQGNYGFGVAAPQMKITVPNNEYIGSLDPTGAHHRFITGIDEIDRTVFGNSFIPTVLRGNPLVAETDLRPDIPGYRGLGTANAPFNDANLAGALWLMTEPDGHAVSHSVPSSLTTSYDLKTPDAPPSTDVVQVFSPSGQATWQPYTAKGKMIVQEDGANLPAHAILNFGQGLLAQNNALQKRIDVTLQANYQTIYNGAGTALAPRPNLKLSNRFSVVDEPGTQSTVIDLNVNYQTIINYAGTPMTARPALKFGEGFTLSDHADGYTIVQAGNVTGDTINITKAPYNAVGDDATDNTVAIQAALDTGKNVLVPPGIFRHSGTLIPKKGMLWLGAGMTSVLKYTGTGVQIREPQGVLAGDPYGHIRLKDLHLTCTSTATIAVELIHNYEFSLNNVKIDGQGTGYTIAGVHIKATDVNFNSAAIEISNNCKIVLCAGDGVRVSGISGVAGLWITHSHIQGNGGWGICTTVPAPPYPATSNLNIESNIIEANGLGQISSDVSYALRIVGNHLEHLQGQQNKAQVKLGGIGFAQALTVESNHVGVVTSAYAFDFANCGDVNGSVSNNSFVGFGTAAIFTPTASGLRVGNQIPTGTTEIVVGSAAKSILQHTSWGLHLYSGSAATQPLLRIGGGLEIATRTAAVTPPAGYFSLHGRLKDGITTPYITRSDGSEFEIGTGSGSGLFINPKDAPYNASGSAAVFTGAINASSNQLTLTTASHDYKIGHGIEVTGAGVSSTTLVTKVTAIAGAVLTLQDNASTTQAAATVNHNDTAALIAAEAASIATGQPVRVPAGIYLTNNTFAIRGGADVRGAGVGCTIIRGTHNNVIVLLTKGAGYFTYRGPTLMHLSIEGINGEAAHVGQNSSQIGIVADCVPYLLNCKIEDVTIDKTGSHGLYVKRAFSSIFRQMLVSCPYGSGYPFVFDVSEMPGNKYEHLYPADVNASAPAGIRLLSGSIVAESFNGINATRPAGVQSWFAIIGQRAGQYTVSGYSVGSITVPTSSGNRSASAVFHNTNFESNTKGGVQCLYNSRVAILGDSSFAGDGSAIDYIPLQFEVYQSDPDISVNPPDIFYPDYAPKSVIADTVTFANNTTVQLSGTVSASANSNILNGVDTTFLTQLAVGRLFRIGSTDYRVQSINSNTQLIATTNFTAAFSAQAIHRYFYKEGALIHANDLPPVMIEGEGLKVAGEWHRRNYYWDTTLNKKLPLHHRGAQQHIEVVTGTTTFNRSGVSYIEANCAANSTITLPWAGWYPGSSTRQITIKNVSSASVTVTINAGGGSSINGVANYVMAPGEALLLMPNQAANDYRVITKAPPALPSNLVASHASASTDWMAIWTGPNQIGAGLIYRLGGGGNTAVFMGAIVNNEHNVHNLGGPGYNSFANIYAATKFQAPFYEVSNGMGWYSGTFDPEGAVALPAGSLFSRTNGSVYKKASGAGTAGWQELGREHNVFSDSTALAFRPKFQLWGGYGLQARDTGLATEWRTRGVMTGFNNAVTDLNARGYAETTSLGTVAAGTLNQVTISNLPFAADWLVGNGIWLAGLGAGGGPHVTKVTAINDAGTLATLETPCVSAGTNVQLRHDDRVSLQPILDAQFGRAQIFIPPGFYTCQGPLIFRHQTGEVNSYTIAGAGLHSTSIIFQHGGNGFEVEHNADIYAVEVRDLSIATGAHGAPYTVQPTTSTGHGFDLMGARVINRMHFSNVRVIGFGRFAVAYNNMQGARFENCWFRQNGSGGILALTNDTIWQAADEPNANTFTHLQIDDSPYINTPDIQRTDGAMNNNSRLLNTATGGLTSAHVGRIVRVVGRGLTGGDLLGTIKAVNSSTQLLLSSTNVSGNFTGATFIIEKVNCASIYMNRAKHVLIESLLSQGNYATSPQSVGAIRLEQCGGALIKNLWSENVGGYGGLQIDLTDCANTSIEGYRAHGESGGYFKMTRSYGLRVREMVAQNPTLVLQMDETSDAVDIDDSEFYSADLLVSSFLPHPERVVLGDSVSFFVDRLSANNPSIRLRGTRNLYDAWYGEQWLQNPRFADGKTGYTDNQPSDWTIVTGSGRSGTYALLNAQGQSAAGVGLVWAQTVNIPDNVPPGRWSLGYDYYVESFGAAPTGSQECLIAVVGTNGAGSFSSFKIESNNVSNRALGRWHREQYSFDLGAGTSRSFSVQLYSSRGPNSPRVRFTNFRLQPGRHVSWSHDQPLTEYAGGSLRAPLRLVNLDAHPGNPPAGSGYLYGYNNTTWYKTSAGTQVDLALAGGGGFTTAASLPETCQLGNAVMLNSGRAYLGVATNVLAEIPLAPSTPAQSNQLLGSNDAANGFEWKALRVGQTGFLDFPEIAAPDAPASGFVRMYAKSGGSLYRKNSANTETAWGSGGGGSAFDPCDPSIYYLRDDFSCGSSTSGDVGELRWLVHNWQGTATLTPEGGTAARPGRLVLGVGATGDAVTLYLPDSCALTNLGGQAGWEFTFILKISSAGNNELFLMAGLVDNPTAGAPYNQSNYLAMVSAPANNPKWDCWAQSGGNTSTASSATDITTDDVRLRIRSTTAGTIKLSVNGGTEVELSSNISTASMRPFVYLLSYTGARSVTLDFFAAKMTGLTR